MRSEQGSVSPQQLLLFGGMTWEYLTAPWVRVRIYRFWFFGGGRLFIYFFQFFAVTHKKVFVTSLRCHHVWSWYRPVKSTGVRNTPAPASINDTCCHVLSATTIATVTPNPVSVWIPDLWFSFAADNSLTCTLRILADFLRKLEKQCLCQYQGKKPLSSFQAQWKDRWHRRNDAACLPAYALWWSCGAIITQTIDDTPDCEVEDQRKPRCESPVRRHQHNGGLLDTATNRSSWIENELSLLCPTNGIFEIPMENYHKSYLNLIYSH